MSSNAVLQSYHIQQHQIALFVPVTLSSSTHVHAPYWAKVWPAAIGLCYFLQDHLYYIHKKKVKEIAYDLIQLYAKRKALKGFQFSPDTYMQNELEASFIYEDTPDQIKSTSDVKKD
ncbi:MAG: hypothetical protein WCG67_05950, partial [Ferruginibacter sp.]